MIIEIDNDHEFVLKDVFSGVGFETKYGEKFAICMRDQGFEFNYGGFWWSAQGSKIEKLGPSI